MMSCLPWGIDITALGAGCHKENLAVLLSDNWIDSETIDMMMFDLAARILFPYSAGIQNCSRKRNVVASISLHISMETTGFRS
jgi:hypothetical protein